TARRASRLRGLGVSRDAGQVTRLLRSGGAGFGHLGARLVGRLPTAAGLAAVRKNPRQDLRAGLSVAIVALPLALAFGVASGMGARAGLVTAVVAGIVAAVFGGSNLQVSGPTGAMTVVLVPVFHDHGPAGVLMVGAMAGVVLIA